jgi:hypothetical protein
MAKKLKSSRKSKSSPDKNPKKKGIGKNKFKSDRLELPPKIFVSFAEELKEVLRVRGKIDP